MQQKSFLPHLWSNAWDAAFLTALLSPLPWGYLNSPTFLEQLAQQHARGKAVSVLMSCTHVRRDGQVVPISLTML